MVHNALRRLFVLLFGAILLLPARPVWAQSAPANDNLAQATAISALPFSDVIDLDGATTEPGEPQVCNFQAQTVWYAFTSSSSVAVTLDLNGSDPGVVANVYQSFGGGFNGLSFLGCMGFGGSKEFVADPNAMYVVQAGSVSTGPAHLQLHLQAVPPPVNDNFANATRIDTLPFDDPVDMTAATTEPGEPVLSGFTPIVASAWYAFTAPATESLTAAGNSCCVTPITAVYTGTSLTALTLVASSSFSPATFRATAGTTYYFQLGRGFSFGGAAPMSFRLQVAPPVEARFFFSPSEPSIFSTIDFRDTSFDPVSAGFQSESWTFGDGSAATGCCPSHRYAADGDYAVRLDVITVDGRTASTSQIVHVKTHDVVIAKFTVPQTASAGQTRTISVGITDLRYPEVVEVEVLKSTPGGNFQGIGILTQSISPLPSNRTTPFTFNYTFTSDDAAAGKVTFEAVARILGADDAQPADNTVIALPTAVHA